MQFQIENFKIEGDMLSIDFYKMDQQRCSRLNLPIERLKQWAIDNDENYAQAMTFDGYGNPGLENIWIPVHIWVEEYLSDIHVQKFLHSVISKK